MHLRLFFIQLLFISCSYTIHAKTVVETLEADDRFRIFVQQLNKTDLLQDLDQYPAATVFAPTDKAFDDLKTTTKDLTRAELLYHIIPESILTKEWYNGKLFETSYTQDGNSQKIKLIKNNKGKWSLADNVDVIDTDLGADNGVVQVVNGLLTPPKDLVQTLAEQKELNTFSNMAKKAHIETELKHANGYTIFATQDVLDGLTDAEKDYLNHPEAKNDLAQVLRHQISGTDLYFGKIPNGKTLLNTLQGENLELVLDKNNQVTVNGVKIIQSDILASNGVIHVLEKSILPKNRDFLKIDLRKALIGINATKLVSLFENNGLESYLKTKDAYTIVAPSNDELDERNIPRSEIQSWLKYHIINNKYDISNFTDGLLVKSESSNHLSENDKQRILIHIIDQDQMPVNVMKKSIQFNHATLIGNPVDVENSIIYPVSRSLELPLDPLSQLPLDLDLSTFVASLYSSNTAYEIKSVQSITLFAPTNKAFARLGILTKHLLQPDSQHKLARVIKFHAIKNELYYINETKQGEYRVPTLDGSSKIQINKTKDGHMYLRGSGAGDGSDRSVIAEVVHPDMLVSNGVIHKIDRIEIPPTLQVSNRDLLLAENTNSFVNLIHKTNLSDQIFDGLVQPYTVLAPSNHAFAKLNITHLFQNPDQLLRVAKMHILPTSLPKMTLQPGQGGDRSRKTFGDNNNPCLEDDNRNHHPDITKDGVEFSPLLENEKLIISQIDAGYTVQVKSDKRQSADVVNIGRGSNGGGVIVIDHVLLPYDQAEHAHFLAWWVVMLIVFGVLLSFALVATLGYYAWRWWIARRQGHISLEEEEEEEEEE